MAIIILTTLNSYEPYLLPIVNVLEKIVDRQVVEFLVTIVRFPQAALPWSSLHTPISLVFQVLASPCDMRRELGVFG